MEALMIFAFGWLVGLLSFIGYGAIRALGSDGWDDSNLLNWLRLLSHVVMHPQDMGKVWFVKYSPNFDMFIADKRPFWYISKDEFSEVVKSRPK